MLVAGHGPSKRTALSVRLRAGLLGVERKRPVTLPQPALTQKADKVTARLLAAARRCHSRGGTCAG